MGCDSKKLFAGVPQRTRRKGTTGMNNSISPSSRGHICFRKGDLVLAWKLPAIGAVEGVRCNISCKK